MGFLQRWCYCFSNSLQSVNSINGGQIYHSHRFTQNSSFPSNGLNQHPAEPCLLNPVQRARQLQSPPSKPLYKYVLCCVIWYISPGTGLLDHNFTNVTFGALYTLFRMRATLSCKRKFGLDFRPPKCLSISVVLVVAVWLLLLQLPSLARDEQLSWRVL